MDSGCVRVALKEIKNYKVLVGNVGKKLRSNTLFYELILSGALRTLREE